jgi:translocator protein
MNKYLKLIMCIAAPLLTGAVAGYVTSSHIKTWYITLEKPFFSPPNYLFAPVWTCLYILMGLSWWLIWQNPKSGIRQQALGIFYVQWALNFLWSFLFFYFQQPGWALVEILILWSGILAMIIAFNKIDKTAARLQLPYLAWVSFASLLNAAVWWLNK